MMFNFLKPIINIQINFNVDKVVIINDGAIRLPDTEKTKELYFSGNEDINRLLKG